MVTLLSRDEGQRLQQETVNFMSTLSSSKDEDIKLAFLSVISSSMENEEENEKSFFNFLEFKSIQVVCDLKKNSNIFFLIHLFVYYQKLNFINHV